MIQKLMKHQRLEISLLLIMMTLFCFSLSLFRYYMTDTKVFFFLNWNLFLAWIPLIITSFAVIFNVKSKLSLMIMVIIWILFFPNSPYILTDLFHLKVRSSIPIWYDLVVILSYAWTGLICGFISLGDIEKFLSAYLKRPMINLIVVVFLFVSSFGVYLGRFLRWNSWDILNNPFGLFNDIIVRFVYPLEHTKTWGVTLLLGVMLNFMYFMIKVIKKEHPIITPLNVN
ncbi:DUF1361 domain-containing protein [Chryseobacterium daecheongense]|uniref:DUF1361 domain-containing protein n=1 Tax=Chryseobacterium daecheongense TaxID=192389 RepID=UPI001FD6FE96|nr:DUF1361 domain-containing protein [Chryseobacterium daecheongense]UOU98786.1 DUF1361 domain-containing protein [Chryseobacterium daecheongense]